jgi:hypothetical protein
VQQLPGLFAELRGLIDGGRRQGQAHGRFLLLGGLHPLELEADLAAPAGSALLP